MSDRSGNPHDRHQHDYAGDSQDCPQLDSTNSSHGLSDGERGLSGVSQPLLSSLRKNVINYGSHYSNKNLSTFALMYVSLVLLNSTSNLLITVCLLITVFES